LNAAVVSREIGCFRFRGGRSVPQSASQDIQCWILQVNIEDIA